MKRKIGRITFEFDIEEANIIDLDTFEDIYKSDLAELIKDADEGGVLGFLFGCILEKDMTVKVETLNSPNPDRLKAS